MKEGRIKKIKGSGILIILEDQSAWNVPLKDSFLARRWGLGERVRVHGGSMINLDRQGSAVPLLEGRVAV